MGLSYKWKIVITVILATFMTAMDSTIVNIALSRILLSFNEPINKVQFVASAYLMAMAVGTPLSAFAGKKFGMKRVFLFAQIFFLIGSMLCGLSWNLESLIIFRIVQGFSGGLLFPIALTLLWTTVPAGERGSVMGAFGIVQVLAPTIGMTLGGYLVEYINWRWCFYVNVPFVIIGISASTSWIKKEAGQVDLPLDMKGFVLASLGFSTLLYALSNVSTWGWRDTHTLVLFAISAVSLVSLVIIELREKIPLLDLRVFKFVNYTLGTVVMFATIVGFYAVMLLIPLFLQNLRGLGAMQTGLLLIPQALGSWGGTMIGGRLYDKIGARLPIVAGLILAGFMTWRLSTLDVTTANHTLMLITALNGVGLGLAMIPAITSALDAVPLKLVSQANTINRVLSSVFASMGAAIFASLLSSYAKTNLAVMTQTVTPDSGMTLRVLSTAQVSLQKAGMSAQAAHQSAVYLLYQKIAFSANVLSFDKVFIIGSALLFVAIIPALFLRGRAKTKETKNEAVMAEC